MAYEFKLPDLGEGVAEGEVVRWLVKEGERVAEDQPLAEVLTDKATVEIPSPRAGLIVRLGAAEGERVPVGHVLVEIEEDSVAAVAARPADVAAGASTASAEPAAPAAPAFSPTVRPAALEAAGLLRAVEATPAVRSLARELGVDLAQVKGSGPGGRITADDVRALSGSPASSAAAASAPAPEPATASPDEERLPLRGLRRRIAEQMTKSHRLVPQFTFVAEADFTAVVEDRERRKEEAARAGVKLTYLAYVLRALAGALHAFPILNASLDDERQEIVVKERRNVAIAVDTAEGLTVPVIHDVEKLELFELARRVEELAEAGRSNRLRPEQLTGGTFTVTTTGAKGGVLATPIVLHPQVAILGVHAIGPRAVVRNREIVIRDVGNLSLSMDHRVIDGQMGAEFLYDVVRRLETWPKGEPA